MAIPLWFQIIYPIWQFIRVAKLFKLAYGIPYHFVLHFRRKVWFPPFKSVSCCLVIAGKKFDFDVQNSVRSKLKVTGVLATANLDRDADVLGTFGNFNYIIPGSKLHLVGDFSFHRPDVLALTADYITEDFCIVDFYDQGALLEKSLDPNTHLIREIRRVLLYPSTDSTLNQNFIRILSIGPLVFTSRNLPTVSTWFTVGVVVVDLFFSTLLQSCFKRVQRGLVFVSREVIKRVPDRRRRYSLSLFLSSVSESVKICDTLAGNFYDLEPGSMALLNNLCSSKLLRTGRWSDVGSVPISWRAI